jgi:hypothetical protein
LATALDAEKAIDLAGDKWKREMKELVRSGKRSRIILDATANNHIIEYIDFDNKNRLATMVG